MPEEARLGIYRISECQPCPEGAISKTFYLQNIKSLRQGRKINRTVNHKKLLP